MISLRKLELPQDGMETLAEEASAEGYRFIERLRQDWAENENRFDADGEVLLGAFEGELLVGVGGLNRDPFAEEEGVGRLRRVYVRQAWRKTGVGGALVCELLEQAREVFAEVRLHSGNPAAIRLYKKMGFEPFVVEHSTHRLRFPSVTRGR